MRLNGNGGETDYKLCIMLKDIIWNNINLVDPASSHMLVSKIKPCMSKYKQFIQWNCEWLIKSVIVYLIVPLLHGITVVILELIHA